jgi:hypothetical protein
MTVSSLVPFLITTVSCLSGAGFSMTAANVPEFLSSLNEECGLEMVLMTWCFALVVRSRRGLGSSITISY